MTALPETTSVARLALRVSEAAEALGVSEDFFAERIAHELKWVRRGRCKLVSVAELQQWLYENGEHVLNENGR